MVPTENKNNAYGMVFSGLANCSALFGDQKYHIILLRKFKVFLPIDSTL